jgi:ribosomal protein L10
MRKLMILGTIAAFTLTLTAAVAMAGPGCSGAKKASSSSCSAAKQVSSSSCSSTKQASTGYSCSFDAKKAAALDALDIDTTRLPSGAMLVFYTSDDPAAVKKLHASAATGAGDIDCRLCQKMASDKGCTIEMAFIDNGVVALVTAENVGTIDAYEKQYASLTTDEATSQQ